MIYVQEQESGMQSSAFLVQMPFVDFKNRTVQTPNCMFDWLITVPVFVTHWKRGAIGTKINLAVCE